MSDQIDRDAEVWAIAEALDFRDLAPLWVENNLRWARIATLAANHLERAQDSQTTSDSAASTVSEGSVTTPQHDLTISRLQEIFKALSEHSVLTPMGSIARSVRIRPLPVDIDLVVALEKHRGDQTLDDAVGQALGDWVARRKVEEFLKDSDGKDGSLTEAELEEGQRAWREA